jgi:hypothetical protein
MAPGVCLAGPMGDGFRALLRTGAVLLTTFEASSHFEAMNHYYALMSWGAYTTEYEQDHQPYSEHWRSVQLSQP